MKSNKPCKFGQNCKKGDQCEFSHDFSSGGGNFGPMGGGGGNPMGFGGGGPGGPSGSKVCKFGINCRKNQTGQCTFLHDGSQMPTGGGGGQSGQGGNTCYNCGQTGHFSNNCPQKFQGGGQMSQGGGGGNSCFICGQPGHFSNNCPQKQGGGQMSQGGGGGNSCYNCGQIGHMSKNCPQKSGGIGGMNQQPMDNMNQQQIQGQIQGQKYPLQMDQLCKNYQKGTCQFGQNCRYKHEYTLKGDIYLKGQFTGFGQIVLIQKLPDMMNNKNLILVLSSKQAQIFQESDTENGLVEMYKKDIQEQELEATTAYYMNKYLFIALVNTVTPKSQIMMINLNNNSEFNQTEFHNAKIISILFLDSILVTTASDSKIKFWLWSDPQNKFEYKNVYQHQNSEITVIIDKLISNQKCLLVGDSNGALTVYQVNIAQDSSVSLISQYNLTIHQGPIQSIILTQLTQDIKFITCSLDGSVAVSDPQNSQNNNCLVVDEFGLTQLITACDFYQKPLFIAGLNNGSVSLYEIQSNDALQNFGQNQYANLIVHVLQGYNKGGKYGQNQTNSVTALHQYSHDFQGENYNYFLVGTQNGTWSYWAFKKPVI